MAAQKPKTGDDSAQDTEAKPAYSITTKKDGFRRAGRAWSGTTTIKADELTERQIAQLVADPMFVVVKL